MATHLRSAIFVSLRTAASVVTPSSPMPLPSRLQARGRMERVREKGVSMGADGKANTQELFEATANEARCTTMCEVQN